jgi:gluconolactonase
MQRRALLTASVASATVATLKAASAATEGPFGETGVPLVVPSSERLTLGPLSGSRYPDPHIEALDEKRFKGRVGTGAVERVATGMRWAEGPAYFAAGRYLVFSDIPNNRMMRLSEDDNHLSVFRSPSFTRTVTQSIGRDAWSVASMGGGASLAPSTTAPSR